MNLKLTKISVQNWIEGWKRGKKEIIVIRKHNVDTGLFHEIRFLFPYTLEL